jgi:hypothetical protein
MTGIKAMLLRGVILAQGKPVSQSVTILQNAPSPTYNVTFSRPTGEYCAQLMAGRKYTVTCVREGMAAVSTELDLSSLSKFEEKTLDLKLEPLRKEPVVTASVAPQATAAAASSPVKKDGFVPVNKLQEKTMRYVEKYSGVAATGLEFRVQLSAVKGTPDKSIFPKRFGKIEIVRLNDGFSRITVGGAYKSIDKAFEMNKKVVKGGYREAFVIAIYNGKRVQFGDLESFGVFK